MMKKALPYFVWPIFVLLLFLAAIPKADGADSPERMRPAHFLDPNPLLSRAVKIDLGQAMEADAFDIQVVSNENAIFLYGRVETSEQKERAGAIAGGVSGISRVVNSLNVKH